MTRNRQGRNRRSTKNKFKFDHRLVLTNWMLELFGVATFNDLGKHMRDPEKLLSDLNAYLKRFNEGNTPQQNAA